MTLVALLACLLLLAGAALARVRLQRFAVLPPADAPPDPDHRFLFPAGHQVDPATRRAASAYARAAGLEVLDLVPGDWPVTEWLALVERMDPLTVRPGPCWTAGQALLVHRSLLERHPAAEAFVEGRHAGRLAWIRAATTLKLGARAQAFAVAPSLHTLHESVRVRRLRLHGPWGEGRRVAAMGVVWGAILAVTAWGLLTPAPVGLLPVLVLHLQAELAAAGTGLPMSGRARALAARLPIELLAWARLLRWAPGERAGWSRGAPPARPEDPGADLAPTALFTAAVWAHAGITGADLLVDADARRIRRWVGWALRLAGPRGYGLPELERGLLERHRRIDAAVDARPELRLVELGAGLGPRGLARARDGRPVVEIDRAHVILRKRLLLARTPAGQADLALPHWRLLAADLLAADLASLLPGPDPAAIVAEGLFMYLTPRQRRLLWRRIGAWIAARPGSFLLFDLLPAEEEPVAGPPGGVLAAVLRRATGGARLVARGTEAETLRRELAAAGLPRVTRLGETAPGAWPTAVWMAEPEGGIEPG